MKEKNSNSKIEHLRGHMRSRIRDILDSGAEGLHPQHEILNSLRDGMPRETISVWDMTQMGYYSRAAFKTYNTSTYFDSGYSGKWCHSEITDDVWQYSNFFENDNIGGYIAPNSRYNQLDYTVKYKFEIVDVVENYDLIEDQNNPEAPINWGGTEFTADTIVNWWDRLGVDSDDWANSWNRLRAEGWLDLFGPRIESHCEDESITPNADADFPVEWVLDGAGDLVDDEGQCYCGTQASWFPSNNTCRQYQNGSLTTVSRSSLGTQNNIWVDGHPYGGSPKVMFEAGPFEQGPDTQSSMIPILEEGFTYKFEYPSIYVVLVTSLDTYGNIGLTWEAVDARDLVKINPIDWAQKVQDYGAGEIMITSVNNEGLKKGFDINLTKKIS